MSVTVEKVKEVVRDGFPDAEPDIQEDNQRITGVIYWPDFKVMTPEERNRLVTERVRKRLGSRGLNVGFLIPLASKDEL